MSTETTTTESALAILREHASTLLAEDRAEALAFILGIYDDPQPWPSLGELERRYAEDFDWTDTDDYEAKRDADAASEAVTRVLRSMTAKIDELAGDPDHGEGDTDTEEDQRFRRKIEQQDRDELAGDAGDKEG